MHLILHSAFCILHCALCIVHLILHSAWVTAFAYGTSYFSAVVFVGYAGQHGRNIGVGAIWIGGGKVPRNGRLRHGGFDGRRTRRQLLDEENGGHRPRRGDLLLLQGGLTYRKEQNRTARHCGPIGPTQTLGAVLLSDAPTDQ